MTHCPLGEILFTLGDLDQEQGNSQNHENELHGRWGLKGRLGGLEASGLARQEEGSILGSPDWYLLPRGAWRTHDQ